MGMIFFLVWGGPEWRAFAAGKREKEEGAAKRRRPSLRPKREPCGPFPADWQGRREKRTVTQRERGQSLSGAEREASYRRA
jgi:hypothetical protein